MKRVLVALVFTVVTFSVVASQAGVEFAPIVGYRLNNMSSDDGSYQFSSSTPGYQIGGLVLYSFLETIALRTGALYTKRTTNGKFNNGVVAGDFKDDINYLDIPIDIQLRLRPTSFYLFGGLKLGFKSSETVTINSGSLTATPNSQSTDDVLNLGVGYELIDLHVLRLAIEAEYESGLSNISGSPGTTFKTNGYAFNAVAFISL